MAWLLRFVIACVLAAPALAQDTGAEPEPPMTYERLGRILFALDGAAQPVGPGFQLTIAGVPVLVVTDPAADRMRAMVPLRPAEGLTAEELMRMMQANFDTALDARYAVARGQLWAVFIHPLSALQKDQLISGLGQTVNIARTYGTLYTGGALQFGGGDSPGIQRQLIEELLEKGEEI
ncbi:MULTISPECIES: hypothetical protein [Leisingera]|jgi:hypothetical protein|uniref:hypothetical protein n=1 Tax=Leisingera TaxID=191028 RepID=UPI00115409E6|nr:MULTISPECIES: hypothetical protein [Leisingera]QDI74652.1 hypothetical protein R2C4_02295 [Leisingera aquaemixtae]UWQ24223.1 hypothetical protein K3553_14850 [Leisingera aquaemixtae]